jgi:hypothetical protein
VFRIVQRFGNIRIGVKGSQQEQTAQDSFHIAFALYPAGNFKTRGTGKRDKMESIAYPQEFLQERTGNIINNFPVRAAHTG